MAPVSTLMGSRATSSASRSAYSGPLIVSL